MTTKQGIISVLQTHPEGVDDDELTQILGLSQRQQRIVKCFARMITEENLEYKVCTIYISLNGGDYAINIF